MPRVGQPSKDRCKGYGHQPGTYKQAPRARSMVTSLRRAGVLKVEAARLERADQQRKVGTRGFEPPTSSSRTRRATRLRYVPTEGHIIPAGQRLSATPRADESRHQFRTDGDGLFLLLPVDSHCRVNTGKPGSSVYPWPKSALFRPTQQAREPT